MAKQKAIVNAGSNGDGAQTAVAARVPRPTPMSVTMRERFVQMVTDAANAKAAELDEKIKAFDGRARDEWAAQLNLTELMQAAQTAIDALENAIGHGLYISSGSAYHVDVRTGAFYIPSGYLKGTFKDIPPWTQVRNTYPEVVALQRQKAELKANAQRIIQGIWLSGMPDEVAAFLAEISETKIIEQ